MIKTELTVKNLSYSYSGTSQEIFSGLNFTVKSGEFIALVGPSGCGKTTLIHILAGLLNNYQGQVLLEGQNISRLGKLSLMPQEDLLLPWRTVSENAALPLEIQGVKKKEALSKVDDLLKIFGLAGFEKAYPYQISGGMRQRVSFLRSVVSGSKIFLLDEPFSALDALTRLKMQEWLLELWQKFQPTIIFITHDVEEALFLSQRIFLLKGSPVKNLNEFTLPFTYPRTRTLLAQQELVELRQKILRGLEGLSYGL